MTGIIIPPTDPSEPMPVFHDAMAPQDQAANAALRAIHGGSESLRAALERLKDVADDRGGLAALLDECGEQAYVLSHAIKDFSALVKKYSDLPPVEIK